MKSSEIKVGRDYVVRFGHTAENATVLRISDSGRRGRRENVVHVKLPWGSEVEVLPRAVLRPVELTQERKMDLLVAFVDGFSTVPHTSPEHLAVAVQALESKPTVVGFTEDGLPLTVAAAFPALVKIHEAQHGDKRIVISRPETAAERTARVYADAMNH